MTITRTKFGALPDGRTADLFTLDGGAGVTAKITNYGGIVTSILAPDRDGRAGEVNLGFDRLEDYLRRPNYYGALIGRVCNRIGEGRFTLDDKEYQLYRNPDGIHLHGGEEGFNRKLWRTELDAGRLRLDYVSPDGEENYPGELSATVWYSLLGDTLKIQYQAITDAPTIVNLTNHCFFNLNCCRDDILKHEVRIQADGYTPLNASLVPTGEIVPVRDTVMDFNAAKPIGRDLARFPDGYDNNFIFARTKPGFDEWLVDVYEPTSGRTLSMATTEPCAQFYIGNFMDGLDVGHDGVVYKRRYAFCLEAQKHPDAINHDNFASIVLRPGETYRQTTLYKFGVRG